MSSRTVWGTQRAAVPKQNGAGKRKIEHNTVLKEKQINFRKQNLSRPVYTHRCRLSLVQGDYYSWWWQGKQGHSLVKPSNLELLEWLVERIDIIQNLTQSHPAMLHFILKTIQVLETPGGLEHLPLSPASSLALVSPVSLLHMAGPLLNYTWKGTTFKCTHVFRWNVHRKRTIYISFQSKNVSSLVSNFQASNPFIYCLWQSRGQFRI